LIGVARNLQLQLQSCHNAATLPNPLAPVFRNLRLFRIRQLESYYSQHFQNLNASLAKRHHDAMHYQGLVFVVGTLSAGGTERQVTLTLRGLANRGIKPFGVVVAYLRNAAERFYQHDLDAAGIPIIALYDNASKEHDTLPTELQELVNGLPVALREVKDYVRKFVQLHPDTVHLWLDEINVKGGIAAMIAGVPRIILSGRSLPPTIIICINLICARVTAGCYDSRE